MILKKGRWWQLIPLSLAVLVVFPGVSVASAAADSQLNMVADASSLSDGSANGPVVLRRLVNQEIAQNEGQQILTDVTIADLQSNTGLVQHNEDTPHFAASVNKLPVAWLTLQDLRAGKFHMSDVVTWVPSDVRAGSGVFDQPGAPLQATVADVIYDMLNHSGNTAVRILVNYELGQAAAVNARLDQYPQIPQTRLQPLASDPTRFFLGNTTSRESLWILEQLLQTKDSTEQFMEHAMATNIFTDFGVRSQLSDSGRILLVNKIGFLDDPDGFNRHDVGVIYNTRTHKAYGYSFLTTSPAATSDTSVPQAESSLKNMGADLLHFAGDKQKPAQASTQSLFRGQLQPEKKTLY